MGMVQFAYFCKTLIERVQYVWTRGLGGLGWVEPIYLR